MGIGVSVFLIALGAILTFAVHVAVSGLDLSTIGVILMVVGGIGLVASLVMMSGAGWGRRGGVVSDGYVEDEVIVDPVRRRRGVNY